jgi:hypothetical protein
VVLAGLILGGCTRTATVYLPRHELRISEDEYRVLPRKVSVAAGLLKVVVSNNGVLAHNLVIEHNGTILREIPTVLPGRASLPIKVSLAPGTYLLASTLSNQVNLGMTATLIVR